MSNILVISPQPWGGLEVSKHHYARELSQLPGNRVFFLNPPSYCNGALIRFSYPRNSQLTVIDYTLYSRFVYLTLFKARPVFDVIMFLLIRFGIRKAIPVLDEVWCFDSHLFRDLTVFGAKRIIFFPVDAYSAYPARRLASQSDLVVSVSRTLLAPIEDVNGNVLLINHGLAHHFSNYAIRRLASLDIEASSQGSEKKFGFFGNLLAPQIDTICFMNIITENASVQFHFWGKMNVSENEVSVKHMLEFVHFLGRQPNVFLHRQVTSDVLATEIQSMDGFLLCYDMNTLNKGNNSHKLIECLSTGRVVVSNRFASVEVDSEMIVMPSTISNLSLPLLFKKVIKDLNFYNSEALQGKRIQFSLENTYLKNVELIMSRIVS